MEIQALQHALTTQQEIFAALGVVTVYLFGSRAQQLQGPRSDYDFGILLQQSLGHNAHRRTIYEQLYEIFDGLVGSPTNIDIVFLHDAPLHLRKHVVRHGIILHDSDPIRRGRFHERTIRESADFDYHRKSFEAAILGRIP